MGSERTVPVARDVEYIEAHQLVAEVRGACARMGLHVDHADIDRADMGRALGLTFDPYGVHGDGAPCFYRWTQRWAVRANVEVEVDLVVEAHSEKQAERAARLSLDVSCLTVEGADLDTATVDVVRLDVRPTDA